MFRDNGLGLGEADVTINVHPDDTAGDPILSQLTVSDFPVNSLGNRFQFIVKVYTMEAQDGISSVVSDPIILAGIPSQPQTVPFRGTNTHQNQIETLIEEVTTTNGSPIVSYAVMIDDG